MSVLVRMENPDDCLKCGVRHICNPYVDYWQQDTRKKPKPGQKGCLIICSLPEGHGRLVDADMLKQKWLYKGNDGKPYRDEIDSMPTIVPAERSET